MPWTASWAPTPVTSAAIKDGEHPSHGPLSHCSLPSVGPQTEAGTLLAEAGRHISREAREPKSCSVRRPAVRPIATPSIVAAGSGRTVESGRQRRAKVVTVAMDDATLAAM